MPESTESPEELTNHFDRELTRNRILKAGAEVFGKRGIDDTTVEHILLESELSRGTFYNHFNSKHEVLKTLYKVSTEVVYDRLKEAVESSDTPEGRIRGAVDAYLEIHREGGNLVSVLQSEAIRSESPLAPIRESLLDDLVDLIEETVREVRGASIDPLLVRTLLMAAESLLLNLHEDGEFVESDSASARSVLLRLFNRVLGTDDPNNTSTEKNDTTSIP